MSDQCVCQGLMQWKVLLPQLVGNLKKKDKETLRFSEHLVHCIGDEKIQNGC